MFTTLRTDITIEQICEGFVYNEYEGKGLFGLAGKLTIQPEYQRNYISSMTETSSCVYTVGCGEYFFRFTINLEKSL